ncbi:unnamed protein product [Caenorhabditis auriculariae]|uniref:Uncharacterized protein n=1 Tax=Caenorhabditis auriculariae TaxID=2777116 RepID=A0A8S1HU28_9PELO|nr:unnamed protein product [Caenorhabditis auriculariae]
MFQDPRSTLNHQQRATARIPMSLDATLANLNQTMTQVAHLLRAIELAVIVMAVVIAITLIACTGIFYYSKCKKYRILGEKTEIVVSRDGTYKKGKYDPEVV